MSARKGLRSRDVVVLLVAALLFYLVLIGVRGVSLLGDGRWVVKLLGVGVLLLPLVGVAIIVAEIRFGRAAERLGTLVDDEPEAPADADPTAELDGAAGFERAKSRVEADPGDWRGWYWLAIAYSEARDPGRGRRTMRKAIAMERAPATQTSPQS
ncbi:MAG: hypothetical protein JWN96_3379 [Mycobacterium sp.]|jgi:hypothetical protein|nr:hypothetical protein [Mycobacterium sp.]